MTIKPQYVKNRLQQHKAAYDILRVLKNLRTECNKVIHDCSRKSNKAAKELDKIEKTKKRLIVSIRNNSLT